MIKEIKKKLLDKFINNYHTSRFLNHNQKYSITKKVEIVDHYIWWFKTTRIFSIYRLSKDKHIYFWAELITLEKERYWTCGFHTDSRVNLMRIILSYKVFLRKIQKKIHLPVIGLINKRNIFMKKLNKDIGFQEINKNDKKKFTTIKNYYKIKNTNNYIYFKL